MNKTFFTLTILFLALASSPASAQNVEPLRITHGPYLQNMTDTSVTIMFTTNKIVVPGVYLKAGDEDFKLIRNSTDGQINVGEGLQKVRITGLEPGREYEYKVYAKQILDLRPYVNLDKKYGDSIVSKVFKFKTLDPSVKEISFTVFNDTHNKAGMISRFLDGIDINAQDFYVFNGDIINYISDLELPYKTFIDTAVNRFASEKPFFIVRGNHETRGTYAKDFKQFFDFPDDKYYYSFDDGPVHFIVLDGGEDKADTSFAYFGIADFDRYRFEQLEWLKKDIAGKKFRNAKFRIVVVHMPIIKQDKEWYGMAFLAEHYGPVLEQAGIDLMISGHLHKNIWIPADKSDFGYPVWIASNHNFTEVSVNENRIELRLKDIKGMVVDTKEIFVKTKK